jgi:hypothetical protein
MTSESTVIPARPARSRAGHELVVVQDVPLCTPTTAPWRTGWLLPRCADALRVVADVQEHLVRVGRDRDPVENRARAGALLVHQDRRAAGGAVRVADRVGSALGDRGSSACAARVRSTRYRAEAVPAIPHISRFYRS